jgi:hypothetical protein
MTLSVFYCFSKFAAGLTEMVFNIRRMAWKVNKWFIAMLCYPFCSHSKIDGMKIMLKYAHWHLTDSVVQLHIYQNFVHSITYSGLFEK